MASTARDHAFAPVRLPATLALALALAALAGLSLPVSTARADTLLIQNVAEGEATERPARGSSKASVENRFGAPAQRSGPVGQPPITRWDYQDFVVFFEYDHVVHSVQR